MIIQENFDDFLKKQFVIYAQDVVWNRAVPDVRDGLKPVQRRILESMLYLGLHPTRPYKKCARTVGDCLGEQFAVQGQVSMEDLVLLEWN